MLLANLKPSQKVTVGTVQVTSSIRHLTQMSQAFCSAETLGSECLADLEGSEIGALCFLELVPALLDLAKSLAGRDSSLGILRAYENLAKIFGCRFPVALFYPCFSDPKEHPGLKVCTSVLTKSVCQ
jgi:hypothetical protein